MRHGSIIWSVCVVLQNFPSDVRRSIFGGYSIRWMNKGKTLLLITNLVKLGLLLSILIAIAAGIESEDS